MNKKDTINWGLQCCHFMGTPRNTAEIEAVALVEAWLKEPEEENRLKALKIGLKGDRKLPAVWLALATGTSNGKMIVVDGQISPPTVKPHLTHKNVSTALLISLAKTNFIDRHKNINHCLALYHEIVKS